MSSPKTDDKTYLYPISLGLASRYHRSVFPLMKFKSSLHDVDLVLVATMDELIKMRQLVKNNAEFKKVIHDSKLQYDDLLENKENLANALTKKTFNPFKMLSAYRAVRLLTEAGIALWMETKVKSCLGHYHASDTDLQSTSERLKRQTLSADTQDIQPVGDADLPSDARISAIAVSGGTETHLDNINSFFAEAASFVESQKDLFPDRDPFSDVYEAEDSRTSAVPEDGAASHSSTDDEATSSTSSGSRPSEASISRQGSGNKYTHPDSEPGFSLRGH
ncbi:hypothetical protein F4604DRAFT_1847937 [Suillus subluteus]|nr:hypothetical protein F4604DRAFT_1847937 [Suillus subluteus]